MGIFFFKLGLPKSQFRNSKKSNSQFRNSKISNSQFRNSKISSSQLRIFKICLLNSFKIVYLITNKGSLPLIHFTLFFRHRQYSPRSGGLFSFVLQTRVEQKVHFHFPAKIEKGSPILFSWDHKCAGSEGSARISKKFAERSKVAGISQIASSLVFFIDLRRSLALIGERIAGSART